MISMRRMQVTMKNMWNNVGEEPDEPRAMIPSRAFKFGGIQVPKKLLTAKQAKTYKEIRALGASPNMAYSWVVRRVTPGGNVRKKK